MLDSQLRQTRNIQWWKLFFFCILNTDGGEALETASDVETVDQWFQVAVGKDTGMTLRVTDGNKTHQELMTSQVVGFIHSVFHSRVRLRSEGQPTVVRFSQELKKAGPDMVRETTHTFSHASLGRADRAAKTAAEHILVTRMSMEKKCITRDFSQRMPRECWAVRQLVLLDVLFDNTAFQIS